MMKILIVFFSLKLAKTYDKCFASMNHLEAYELLFVFHIECTLAVIYRVSVKFIGCLYRQSSLTWTGLRCYIQEESGQETRQTYIQDGLLLYFFRETVISALGPGTALSCPLPFSFSDTESHCVEMNLNSLCSCSHLPRARITICATVPS